MPAVFKLETICILSKSNVSIVVCNLYYHFAKPTCMYSHCIGLHFYKYQRYRENVNYNCIYLYYSNVYSILATKNEINCIQTSVFICNLPIYV